MRLDITLIQIEAIRTHLADQFEDDERLLLDTLEGQTDAFEIAKRLLDGIERDEGDAAALTEQMASRKARRDRCEARIEARREALMALMQCAGLDKLPLAEASVSLRILPAKIAVNDPAAVPEEYTRPNPKPNMDAIKAAFEPGDETLPNWLRVEPARPSITVRRK